MAIAITVPRLGWSMDQGTFSGWLKAEGEHVRAGDMLFTLEGDKAAQEVESFDEGVLLLLPDGPKPGDIVLVGQVIGHLVAAGETTVIEAPKAIPEVSVLVVEAPSVPASSKPERKGPIASPRARRVADEIGVDWTALKGSGKGGRIRERDVIEALGHLKPKSQQSPNRAAEEFRPHTPLRLAIARRMTESRNATVPVTLTTTVDATNLVSLREQFRAAGGDVVPSYTDLLMALTARILRDHTVFNARWEDAGLVILPEVNVAFAVDTEAGLLAPVTRKTATLGLRELATQTRKLVERARNGSLTATEMQDATFTVTNLGSFGVDAFTPVINPPQCAILGIGRTRKQAEPVGRRFVAREMMTLSLTFDHRIADGAPAAKFLQAIGRAVENPAIWFIG